MKTESGHDAGAVAFRRPVEGASRGRVRRVLAAAAVLLSTLTAASLAGAPAGAVSPDTVTGSAFGVDASLLGVPLLAPTPTVTLPANGAPTTATAVGASLVGVVSTGALDASTSATGVGGPSESVASSAGVDNLALLSQLTATTIGSSCTAGALGSTGTTTVVGLAVGGTAISLPSPIPANTSLTGGQLGVLSGVVSVTVNAQTQTDVSGSAAMTVDALQITLLSGLDSGASVTVADSRCGTAGTDIDPSPTVTGVSPAAGPLTGGGTVTVTGSGFTPGTTVSFGGTPATGVVVSGPTQVTAVIPAGSAGTVDVTATTPYGTSATGPGDSYTYAAVPTVAVGGLSPASGPAVGGTVVTITGTGFVGPATVSVGGTPATSVTVVSPTEITATTPAGAAGTVLTTVSDPGGTSNAADFTYVPVPTIDVSGLSPASGPTAGGTSVTITGTDFVGPSTVSFGGTPATNVVVVSPTTITADSPGEPDGTVGVTVTDAGGTSNAQNYTFIGGPSLSTGGLSPTQGPVGGGTAVTLTGQGFAAPASVSFGGTPATAVTVVSPTEITATSPSDAPGPANVTVTDPGGTSNAQVFTYVAVPVLTTSGLTPSHGPTTGGTAVTITGSNFAAPSTVTIAGTAATAVTVVSPTEITATSPAGSAGDAPVAVTDAGGTSNTLTFTYVTPPTITGITPASGSPAGGESIEVVGTGLCGVTAVTIGGTSATVTGTNPSCTVLTVTVPPGAGTVPVSVTTAGGTSVSPVGFTYVQPGYWMVASDGGVFAFGGAGYYGSTGDIMLNKPIVAMADTPDHRGYWLFAADGGVFAFGDARFFGSVPGVLGPQHRTLNGPVVAAEATPDGQGYRMFAADGGVFDFGDAQFQGSLPGLHVTLNKPVTAAVSAPVGQGYWLVAGDGGVFTFGSATFEGSMGASSAIGITSMSATPSGHGYWIFSSGGAVRPFGDAVDFGSVAPATLHAPVAYGVSTTTAKGYWLFGTDGSVYAFGDAPFLGSLRGTALNRPIVGGIGF